MPRECNCAGPCGPPEDDGMSRRDFITLIGTGTAAALMGGPAWGAFVQKEGQGDSLAQWKADLLKPSPRRLYHSETHTDVQMPLGGIGTGSFEIGVDGQFTTWQLFNTLRDGHVPFYFAVKAGDTAKLLQTRGGPEWPRIHAVEMTGEYPIAALKFKDADLPVHLEMSAFSPFSPLDTDFSSIPLVGFLFRVTNPTKERQTVSLAAFMQNPVGYDAMGVPISFNSVGFNSVQERLEPHHPNFGGNTNRLHREGKATALVMEAEPGKLADLPTPLTIYTNLNPERLNTPPGGRPKNLTLSTLDHLSADEKDASAKRLIWLEDAAVDLTPDTLKRIRTAVQGGATLLFAGSAMPLLDLYGQVSHGEPLGAKSLRPDILFEDFEGGYDKWEKEGTAFGEKPAAGTLENQGHVSGFVGSGLVNTFLGSDDPKGRLRSHPFTLERNYIRFLVGGGHFETTQIRLLVDGKTVRATSGKDNEHLLAAAWDVREFEGKEARIEIVDDQTGPWGHINVDHIEFADLPGSLETMELLEELLPIRFTGLKKGAGDAAIEFEGRVDREGSRRSHEPRSGLELISQIVGDGSVLVANGPVMNPAESELIGARQRAYGSLAALAGIDTTSPTGPPETAPGHGALALGTLGPHPTALTAFDAWATAWDAFSRTGHFDDVAGLKPSPKTPSGKTINGALASTVEVGPGETVEVPFFLAWRYPNYYNTENGVPMGNHYAETWKSIDAVVREAGANLSHLHERTERFRHTMYDSTLPYWMLDALTSQISTIRHPGVVFRIANGDIYGWEGSNGCCPPTCTHVWGYEQTLSRLFPDLEREMRRIDFFHQQLESGGINNRTDFPSPPHPTREFPFSDGHSSCILKAYREALNHPDESWMRDYWPKIKKGVDYLIHRDSATSGGTPDGTLDDDQWNTYDNAIHGVNTFIGTYYLAALRAGEEMARRMGDAETAQRYHAVFEQGRQKLVDLCWNGEYFEQKLPGYMERSGEYGPGCLSDQVIGQWWAHQLGLGYLLPEEHIRKALASVFKYNWLADFSHFEHNWRKFAGGKDKGLLICTWPKGGRPANTIPYVDEVWTGVEYQVAAHMLYEGMTTEAFSIIKAVRDRYDGVPRAPIPRNPWNEIECGGHYARAMSSWSNLLALSGFAYDGPAKRMAFTPRHTPEHFKSFFAGTEGWGSLQQTRDGKTQRNEIAVVEGRVSLAHLHLQASFTPRHVEATVGHTPVKATIKSTKESVEIAFAEPLTLVQGQSLHLRLA